MLFLFSFFFATEWQFLFFVFKYFCIACFLFLFLGVFLRTAKQMEVRWNQIFFFVPLVLWSWKILIIQASRFLLVLTLCQLRCLYLHMLINCVALLVIHSCCIYRPIALQLLWAAMWVLLRSVALRHSKNFHTNMHESNIRPNTIKSCRLLHVKRWS